MLRRVKKLLYSSNFSVSVFASRKSNCKSNSSLTNENPDNHTPPYRQAAQLSLSHRVLLKPGAEFRSVLCGEREIGYLLARKSVKNVNLRIKPDGMVLISANRRVSVGSTQRSLRFSSWVSFTVRHTKSPSLSTASFFERNSNTKYVFEFLF